MTVGVYGESKCDQADRMKKKKLITASLLKLTEFALLVVKDITLCALNLAWSQT